MTIRSPLCVYRISAFVDNYIWAISWGKALCIVDPGDARPVKKFLHQHSDLELSAILITHHHHDHMGGVAELLSTYNNVSLWVPPYSPLTQIFPRQTHTADIDAGEMVIHGITMQVIATPGHTLDHIVYYLPAMHGDSGRLFCGDTLFSAGCGRLFEGTPTQMLQSLDALVALPEDTWVYCAHEYTLANLRFAKVVDPDNQAIAAYTQQCENALIDQGATLPSRMETELEVNPFLRIDMPALRQSASVYAKSPLNSRGEVFAALRAWKDTF